MEIGSGAGGAPALQVPPGDRHLLAREFGTNRVALHAQPHTQRFLERGHLARTGKNWRWQSFIQLRSDR
jgi:hypothetical protein